VLFNSSEVDGLNLSVAVTPPGTEGLYVCFILVP